MKTHTNMPEANPMQNIYLINYGFINLKRALQFGTLLELISRLYLLDTIFIEWKKTFRVCCQFPLKRTYFFSPVLKQNPLFK